ncbi:acid phosphatase [Williamsia sterculiae]|uniref:acid phosphatase n=1 Tax=Williamsia sterculiae TaxID=1344003 RepID=A0A1N7FTM1_9NOCA|nr:phosphatase PAP2 family protein [Williamsia sterculiae]SIS03624.1 PAP2 superfamily protein [Williamsia sterculiae]
MRVRLAALAVSVAAGVGLLTPASAGAAPAPCTFAPTAIPGVSGYTAAQLADPFATAKPKDHIGVLDAFSRISPVVRAQNLAETVVINNTASPATAQYAVRDNYDIGTATIFNSLGSRLGTAFSQALAAGQLPKVSQLLVGEEAIVEARVGTSAEKKYFQNPRPFEVAPQLIRHYSDGRPDLYEAVRGSGSYPSGHTTWGFAEAFLIATLFPEVGPQVLYRGAEYGYHRVVLGVHYPLDVIGGRMLSESVVTELLGDKKFSALLSEAKQQARTVLAAKVGAPIGTVVRCQQPYVSTSTALGSYRQRETYSFGATGDTRRPVQVPAGAETLIRAAHPGLSDAQLRAILAKTALPSGYPLDKTGANGGWQRLDIAKAWVTS